MLPVESIAKTISTGPSSGISVPYPVTERVTVVMSGSQDEPYSNSVPGSAIFVMVREFAAVAGRTIMNTTSRPRIRSVFFSNGMFITATSYASLGIGNGMDQKKVSLHKLETVCDLPP
jgi:hypothetical protein